MHDFMSQKGYQDYVTQVKKESADKAHHPLLLESPPAMRQKNKQILIYCPFTPCFAPYFPTPFQENQPSLPPFVDSPV